jgi:hypothetical protein
MHWRPSLRRATVLLTETLWAAFALVLIAYAVHLSSDPFVQTPEWGVAHARLLTALAVAGCVAFLCTLFLLFLTARWTFVVLCIAFLPVVQYIAISNAGDLYSYAGDDTGVWQYGAWLPYTRLPYYPLWVSFFPVIREPLWSASMPVLQRYWSKHPESLKQWLVEIQGCPRPFDLKFAAVNSVIWLVIGALAFRLRRIGASRRGRTPPNPAAFVVGAMALVLSLGLARFFWWEGPRLAGAVVARVDAARGVRIYYREIVGDIPHGNYAEALHRLTGIETRNMPPTPTRATKDFYYSYNHVMFNAVEADIGREGLKKALNEASRESVLRQKKGP